MEPRFPIGILIVSYLYRNELLFINWFLERYELQQIYSIDSSIPIFRFHYEATVLASQIEVM